MSRPKLRTVVGEFLCRKNLPEACEIMSKLRQKIPRLKLSLAEYQVMRNQVLKRDGWRCQLCGASKDLQVHHLKSRGNLGDDTMRNLITLCAKCHEALHRTIAFKRERPFE
jgi:5-methylcytosine-specific restriction endonuclease McrA